MRESHLLDEQVKLLGDLPAGIPLFSRDALQLVARQAGNAAPRKQLCHLGESRSVRSKGRELGATLGGLLSELLAPF